jgi:hypothetical protein
MIFLIVIMMQLLKFNFNQEIIMYSFKWIGSVTLLEMSFLTFMGNIL